MKMNAGVEDLNLVYLRRGGGIYVVQNCMACGAIFFVTNGEG